MAPEQATGGLLGPAADVWGIGVVLYEVISGDPACDVVLAWTMLSGRSRDAFRTTLAMDPATWARARGWALWKALIVLQPGRAATVA